MRRSLLHPGQPFLFFGSAMHDGIRGYVSCGKVTIFGTPAEKAKMRDAYRDVDTWRISHPLCQALAEVRICSDDSVLVACRPTNAPEPGQKDFKTQTFTDWKEGHNNRQVCETEPGGQTIGSIASLSKLREFSATGASSECLAQFAPTQLVVNATTATALSQDGRVYTRTTDPRYSSCLGRPYTGSTTFEMVPYLSETRIVKIASGGYMTAAISEDGELFLWGQANPGTEGELSVLDGSGCNSDRANTKSTVIWGDAAQDENIKCLNIHIDGKEASAYDIATGFGHILVAAKSDAMQYVVFAAGCGAEGQLGLGKTCDFLDEFEEVVALRGKQVTQMAAAGWSSFVVIEE